jgi:hypothetical protein
MKIKLIAIAFMFLSACERRADFEASLASTDETMAKQAAPPVERRLIKDGSMEFETTDWKRTKQRITDISDSLGAYSTNESLSNMYDRISYHQVIRVPAARFEALIDKIEKVSGRLQNKTIKVDDISKEYIDLDVRIKNKKEMESRYREFLKHAKNVEEMLKIESYITDVRTEIERMEAGMKSMQERTALSTLEITFYEKIVIDFGFGAKLTAALLNGWQNLLVVMITLANIWPLLILAAGVAFWLKRRTALLTATH